jgi:ureidoglycolate hydrolase
MSATPGLAQGGGVAGGMVKRQVLPLELATPESFAPYGQVILPAEDGLLYGPLDAQLDLSQGVPRFYAMRLTHRGMAFRRITRHRRVTQCLGAMMGYGWMIAVAAPDDGRDTPNLETLRAFLVPGDRFVKLNAGAWHAGPYFRGETADFYNLELADTNVVDHQTCDLGELYGLELEFGPAPLRE